MAKAIERRLAADGIHWETKVVDEGGTGAAPTLAEVLAAGGDPDGNPVTGPLAVIALGVNDTALTITTNGDHASSPLGLSMMGGDGVDAAEILSINGAGGVQHTILGGEFFQIDLADDVSMADKVTVAFAADDYYFELSPTRGTTFRIQGDAGNVLRAGFNSVDEIVLAAAGGQLGFYGTAGIAKQTGVAVSTAGIHAALVALGLFSA